MGRVGRVGRRRGGRRGCPLTPARRAAALAAAVAAERLAHFGPCRLEAARRGYLARAADAAAAWVSADAAARPAWAADAAAWDARAAAADAAARAAHAAACEVSSLAGRFLDGDPDAWDTVCGLLETIQTLVEDSDG